MKGLYGIFLFGQVMAALAASAFAPAGDHDLSRSILDTVRRQSLMTRGEIDPGAAVFAINKAIQKGKKTSTPWTRARSPELPTASSPPCP